MKGVMRFRKKEKLSPHYIGPYQIMMTIGGVAYEVDFPASQFFIHLVFHVSILKNYIRDYSLVFLVEEINLKDSLSYKEEPIAILDCYVWMLRSKEITSFNVWMKNQKAEESTW